MQRPLIILAIGAGLVTPAVFAATSLVSIEPGWAGTLTLKKSVSLTLAPYPRTAQRAMSPPALTVDQRPAKPPPLRSDVQASPRLPQDSSAAIHTTDGMRSAGFDFPSASIPLIEPAQAALIDQTNFWISEGREDLAELALTKLFQISPDNLQGLEALARIQIRRQRSDTARTTVERMRRLQPDALQIKHIEALMRVDGSDREALQEIRQLARSGRPAKAAAAMHALYPDGPPSEEMTLEYWSIVANTPNGRPRAVAGLQELTRRQPGNLRLRLALAALLTSRAPLDRVALAQLIALTEVPAYAKQARAAWRRAMLALDNSAASIALLRFYLAQDNKDSAIQERLAQSLVTAEARRKLLADPNYQAQISGLALLGAGKLDAAAEPLQRAYRTRPADIDLINGLGLLRLRQRRHAESEALFLRAASLDANQRTRWQRMAGVARYWGLLAQAERDAAAKNDALAEQHLRQARAIDPREPAAMLALAALFDAQRRGVDAARIYREVLAQEPANRTALNDLIRLYLRDGQADLAQQLIARLPAVEQQALATGIDRDRAAGLRVQADQRVAAGTPDSIGKAIALLEQAVALDAADPWLRFDLARLYVKRNGSGDADRAERLFADLLAASAPDATALYAAALFEESSDRPLQALATLERVPALERETKLTDLQRRLWLSLRLQRARALAQAGQSDAARSLLDNAAAAIGNDPLLIPQLAEAMAGRNAPNTLTAPTASDAAIDLIDTLIASGQVSLARTEIARQASATLAPDTAAALAGRLIDLQDDAAALALIDTALAAAPTNARLLEQAADIAQRSNQPDLAITYLQRATGVRQATRPGTFARMMLSTPDAALPASTSPPSEPAVYAMQIQRASPANDVVTGSRPDNSYHKLADLLDSRSRWIAGAVDTRSRAGSAGTSQYRSVEIPIEYRQPWHDGSRLIAQAIAVDTGAGTLDLADTGSASRFGSIVLCQPLCSAGRVRQQVRGLLLNVGIERGEWHADIGTTPLGFPIQNMVGGIVKKGDLGKFSYSIDASRRALTGSVLSYAGARDPRTGELWGGVLANGVRLGLSRDDGGALGAWSALGLHRLAGRNLQANDRIQLMAGTYWRIINEDDRLLTLGANAMAWRFSENAGEYTFGHGGYYSAQRFASLALPVTFSQRSARLSWSLRGALSVSRSTTAAAEYFPTRPDLQAYAAGLAAGNGVDPHYTASTGRGVGRSLAAAFEYQVNPALFAGGRFEIDRSTDYAPNRLLFYFRYNLERSSARPVTLPPEPLLPASQF